MAEKTLDENLSEADQQQQLPDHLVTSTQLHERLEEAARVGDKTAADGKYSKEEEEAFGALVDRLTQKDKDLLQRHAAKAWGKLESAKRAEDDAFRRKVGAMSDRDFLALKN